MILNAAEREQLAAIVADRTIGRDSMSSGRASCLSRRIGGRRTAWRKASRSAGRPCGGGNNALPRQGSRVLLRDKTRKPGEAPIAADIAARVVALTCTEPAHQPTLWTGRAMAKATGLCSRSAQRIWQAHQLQPHRIRTLQRSRDPSFAAKLNNIVGLYVDPPTHAVVLSLDEKNQIQALDRTQPGLPIEPGAARP